MSAYYLGSYQFFYCPMDRALTEKEKRDHDQHARNMLNLMINFHGEPRFGQTPQPIQARPNQQNVQNGPANNYYYY